LSAPLTADAECLFVTARREAFLAVPGALPATEPRPGLVGAKCLHLTLKVLR
jgi:hypothetical protein